MTANINPDTGIAYGYIRADALDPDIVNDLQMNGTDVYYDDAVRQEQWEIVCDDQRLTDEEMSAWYAENRRVRGWRDAPWSELDPDEQRSLRQTHVEENWDGSDWQQRFNDSYQPDEPVHEGEKDGVTYRTSWLGGALHVFIANSPYITETARECSLCVPNAGNLDQVGEGHYQCYDVPPEWRREDD